MTKKFLKFSVLLVMLSSALVCSTARAYSILVWGDSLSSSYGFEQNQGWVALLSDRLSSYDDKRYELINASIPGEVSYGGAERISQALKENQPDLVILELGGNDGLQGKDLQELYKNLAYVITSSKDSGAEVLLLGMKIPPNYGRKYADSFHMIYQLLVDQYEISFVPFFLEPIASDFDYVQADGIHPTAAAQPLLLEHIWPVLKQIIKPH